ncbi:MAG: hypothetical protein NXH97_23320 [Rhodobacteraceae bacterium]|nr:hypothetical protein [Paracoccaceae bacterium]
MFELLAAVILLVLLALSGVLIYRLRGLTEEARLLKAQIAEMQRGKGGPAAPVRTPAKPVRPEQTQSASLQSASPQPGSPQASRVTPQAPPQTAPQPPPNSGAPETEADMPAPAMPAMGAARRAKAAASAGAAQGQLPLSPDPQGEVPPLPLDVLIRALQFPETAEDTEGFRALRRALRDHRAGQLLQAAQDVLTLLSQEGLYMDDLPPDRARPELWRRFAQGERGGAVAALGGIRDRSALAMAGGRMREDPVFRDAAHHFLRRFDRMLADLEPTASDAQIAGLTDTRTARAFILLGRVMGIFD